MARSLQEQYDCLTDVSFSSQVDGEDIIDAINELSQNTQAIYNAGQQAINISNTIHWGNIPENQTAPSSLSSGWIYTRDIPFLNTGYNRYTYHFSYTLDGVGTAGTPDFGSYLRIQLVGHNANIDDIYEASTTPATYGRSGIAVGATADSYTTISDESTTNTITDVPTSGTAEWQSIRITLGVFAASTNWLQSSLTSPDYNTLDYEGRISSTYKLQPFYGLHSLNLHLFGNC